MKSNLVVTVGHLVVGEEIRTNGWVVWRRVFTFEGLRVNDVAVDQAFWQ
jgi:hypothetical protein